MTITTTLDRGEMPVSLAKKAEKTVHRHLSPSYSKTFVNVPLVNMIKGKVKNFDFHQCQPMMDLRRNGGSIVTKIYADGSKRYRQLPIRRLRIREERESTLVALLKAIVNNVDYNFSSRHLFECTLSIEMLAKEVGQFFQYEPNYDEKGVYRHGRTSCDPVRGAIDDLEASKLVFVIREFCQEAKTYKASRLFLTPLFFKELGITGKDMAALRKNQIKYYKEPKHARQYRQRKPLAVRIANVEDTRTLNSIFHYHHRWVKGELEAEAVAQRNAEALNKSNEQNNRELTRTLGHLETDSTVKLRQLKARLNEEPRALVFKAEADIKDKSPSLAKDNPVAYLEAVLERLKN